MSTHRTWLGGRADAATTARLLIDFNAEFEQPSPPSDVLTARVERALDNDASVLFGSLDGGDEPHAFAFVRFRPSLWVENLESYLAELYVVPDKRGQGLGRALMNAVLEHARDRGAGYMDIGVDEPDAPARALYESLGFDNHGGQPDGDVSYYYEREL